MRILIAILRAFVFAFGITEPKPEEERKQALVLLGILVVIAGMVLTAALAIFAAMNSR